MQLPILGLVLWVDICEEALLTAYSSPKAFLKLLSPLLSVLEFFIILFEEEVSNHSLIDYGCLVH